MCIALPGEPVLAKRDSRVRHRSLDVLHKGRRSPECIRAHPGGTVRFGSTTPTALQELVEFALHPTRRHCGEPYIDDET
jgi:hypothetical protein